MLVILSLLFFSFLFFPCCNAEFAHKGYHHSFCDDNHGNYTTNDQKNLNTLLADFSSNTTTKITNNFYNYSSNLFNGIGYCRGDVPADYCRFCLYNLTINFLHSCPNQKKATGYSDRCVLRYSDQSIYGVLETSPTYQIAPNGPVNQSDFFDVLSRVLSNLVNKTVAGNSTLKFAIDKAFVSPSRPIYAFAQCSPDLSPSNCQTCLSDSISDLPICCQGYLAVRYFRPTCTVRFATHDFAGELAYDIIHVDTPANSSPTPPPFSSPTLDPVKGRGTVLFKIVAIVFAITIVCLLLGVAVYVCLTRQDTREKKKADCGLELEGEDDITWYESLQIAYEDVKNSTNGFSVANMVGKGGFGTVYKGELENGEEIAVKRLASNSAQGEEEFRNEVLLVAKLQHRNLVRLLGYSFAGDERLLIYEFMPNASLDHFLFGKNKHICLEWDTRYKIIKGIARGLLYLHEDSMVRIIHRDLKAANILLDGQLNPKIADFGMARLFQADQTHADTIRVAGTLGYMPPEYVYHGVYSVKSDIYSFGVLVLEIVTGQRNSGTHESNSNMEDLLTSVWRSWIECRACEVVDKALVSVSRVQVTRCIQLGLMCIQAAPINRPTMSLVNLMLSSESCTIPVPSQPAYVLENSFTRNSHSPVTKCN